MSPQEIIDRLNHILTTDPCCVRTLLEARSLTNSDIQAAAEGFTFKRGGITYLRPLGLLNTVLSDAGFTIGVKYDADGNPTKFLLLKSPTK